MKPTDTAKNPGDLRTENETLKGLVASLSEEKQALETQLAEMESESQRFSERYLLVEQQTTHLSNLCVASQRLHETLDRKELLAIIQEIVCNIIGSEEMGIFEVDAKLNELSLISSWGIEPSAFRRVPMGQGPIGRSATSGEIYIAQGERRDGNLTACIPLKMADQVIGAIAIFRMLPQKTELEALDREIFELLSTQAGMALHCSKNHSFPAARAL